MNKKPERADPLRIAMIGSRGLPATHGGVERHVEELATRLTAAGHDVTVFGRAHYGSSSGTFHGVRVRRIWTVDHKQLEATVHSLLSTLVALAGRYDVVHYHAIGPGLFTPLMKLAPSTAIVQTIHGLDGDRDKWGRLTRWMLGVATSISERTPDAVVVVSDALARRYSAVRSSVFRISNGCPALQDPKETGVLERLGVRPGEYVLFVGRLVPEKAPLQLIRAYRRLDTDLPLVVVGGSAHTDDYVDQVSAEASLDDRVVLAGYIYGDELAQLWASARLFVQPSRLEGLPLTLLEACANRLPVVVSDIDPHLEVVMSSGPGHRVFPVDDEPRMRDCIERELGDDDASREGGKALSQDVVQRYDWAQSAEDLLEVYRTVVRARGRRRRVLGRTKDSW